MSYRILDLRGLRIDRVERDAKKLRLHFRQANVEKIMDNAEQRTLWTQAGALEMQAPKLREELPEAPFSILHSDVEDSLYTQRDMIRIPLNQSGEVALCLWLEGRSEALRVEGSRISLHLEGNPRYVRHLDGEA